MNLNDVDSHENTILNLNIIKNINILKKTNFDKKRNFEYKRKYISEIKDNCYKLKDV